MDNYINGYVNHGSYFTYKGVRYGRGTKILFTEEFYKRIGEYIDPHKTHNKWILFGWKFPYFKVFHSNERRGDKMVWKLNDPNWAMFKPEEYIDVDPERDIEKIVTPVWYMEPKELVKMRLQNGTWFAYVWKQTLVYALCLLISPLFQEWYLIWTIGLYAYLRLCYIELSKGELNRGW